MTILDYVWIVLLIATSAAFLLSLAMLVAWVLDRLGWWGWWWR